MHADAIGATSPSGLNALAVTKSTEQYALRGGVGAGVGWGWGGVRVGLGWG